MIGHLHSFILLLLLILWPLPWAVTATRSTMGVHRQLDSGSLLAGFLIWFLLQFVTATVLGMIGLLSLWPLIMVQVVGFSCGMWWIRSRSDAGASLPILNRTTALTLGVIGGGAFAMAWFTATVPSANFDTLGYHLPAVAEFYQHGGIIDLPGTRATASYPFGWELASVAMIMPFGHDLLITWPNLAAWLLIGLATAHLARFLGATRSAALTGALLVMGTPHVLGRVNGVQVDVALAALFLSSCAAALHVRRGDDRLWTVLLLVLGGACAAVKFSGAVYWTASLGFLLTERTRTARPMPRLGHAMILGVGLALITGGFWYLRNLIQDGSPFGRIGISVAGRTLLTGEYGGEAMATSTLLYSLATGGKTAWSAFGDLLGAGLGWIVLPLALSAVGGMTVPWRGSSSQRDRLILAGMITLTGLLYVLTPASANMGRQDGVTPWAVQALRFAYPWLGLLGVAAALGWSRLGIPSFISILLGLTVFFYGLMRECGPVIPIIAAGSGFLVVVTGLTSRRRLTMLAAMIIVLIAIAPASERRDRGRHALYGPAYAFLDSLGPSSVGVEVTTRPYPLYGRSLQRDLVVLNGRGKSRGEWLGMIREHALPYVVIGPFPREVGRPAQQRLGWLTGSKSREFRRVYHGPIQDDMQIYEVLPPRQR